MSKGNGRRMKMVNSHYNGAKLSFVKFYLWQICDSVDKPDVVDQVARDADPSQSIRQPFYIFCWSVTSFSRVRCTKLLPVALLLSRSIFKDFQKYFTTNSTDLMLFVFWRYVHRRKKSFYTVVYVNIVHKTVRQTLRADKRETLLFYRMKSFSMMYISLCFCTKRL